MHAWCFTRSNNRSGEQWPAKNITSQLLTLIAWEQHFTSQ